MGSLSVLSAWSSARSSFKESQRFFGRVEEVLQHIFESILFDRLVEALELSLRRVALFFLLILLGLVNSWFCVFRTLFYPVDSTILPFFIFLQFVVAFPLLAAVFSLVSVLALNALNFSFYLLSLHDSLLIERLHAELGRIELVLIS